MSDMDFIETYGLVKYRRGIYKHYAEERKAPCNMRGCLQFQAEFTAFLTSLIGVKEPSMWTGKNDWWIGNDHETYWEWKLRNYQTAKRHLLYTEHCHTHGWIRGFVCNSCNVMMSYIDRGQVVTLDHLLFSVSIENWGKRQCAIPDFQGWQRNCPECAIILAPANVGKV